MVVTPIWPPLASFNLCIADALSSPSFQISALGSWVQFSLRTRDTCVKRVSQKSKVVGFFPGTPVPPTGNVRQGGLGLAPN